MTATLERAAPVQVPYAPPGLICDRGEATFFLGIHHVNWAGEGPDCAPPKVAVCISHNQLRGRKSLPVAPLTRGVLIDSGAFTALQQDGLFTESPQDYTDALIRYDNEIGSLHIAGPQDWMCEPPVLQGGWWDGKFFAGTGLSVEEHQRRTVANFVLLQRLWKERGGLGDCPVMPVIQGWLIADYMRCVQMYEDAGVHLSRDFESVGVGSICRRQNTAEIGRICRALAELDIPLHGFGVKIDGLRKYGRYLTTADSMAWSDHYRWLGRPVNGCRGRRGNGVKHCGNCLHAALDWRVKVMEALADNTASLDDPEQLEFGLDDIPAVAVKGAALLERPLSH